MNDIEKKVKEMFPDWKQVKCGEWSAFTKVVTGWEYLNEIKTSNYKELDKELLKICKNYNQSQIFTGEIIELYHFNLHESIVFLPNTYMSICFIQLSELRKKAWLPSRQDEHKGQRS